MDNSGTSQNFSKNSGRKRVPELYSRTILVRTGIAQFWNVLELLHVINNSGTYQNCTILGHTRIEVAKYNMTKLATDCIKVETMGCKTVKITHSCLWHYKTS